MIVHPNCVRRPIFSRMILPCPSRDNGNGNSGFPQVSSRRAPDRTKSAGQRSKAHLPGCGMANLAKTMPFACCPPAFVPSHDGGLFSAQTSQKQLFLRKQVGAPNGFLAESAERSTSREGCRPPRARPHGSVGSARRPCARFRRLVCLGGNCAATNRRFGRRKLP